MLNYHSNLNIAQNTQHFAHSILDQPKTMKTLFHSTSTNNSLYSSPNTSFNLFLFFFMLLRKYFFTLTPTNTHSTHPHNTPPRTTTHNYPPKHPNYQHNHHTLKKYKSTNTPNYLLTILT